MKYYGYFSHGPEEYVIKFRVRGPLKWNPAEYRFEDSEKNTYSAGEIMAQVAFGCGTANGKTLEHAHLLTYEEYVDKRKYGAKRWKPCHDVIEWEQ